MKNNRYLCASTLLILSGLAPAAAAQCETQQLLFSNGSSSDKAGVAVDLSGDVLVTGAWRGAGGASSAGCAYVFERSGSSWVEVQHLPNPTPTNSDYFGFAVAASGQTLVIGAYNDNALGNAAGAAYIYQRFPFVGWLKQADLLPSPPSSGGGIFGVAVDIDGDSVLVGASSDDLLAADAGSVHFYDRSGVTWSGAPSSTRLSGSDTAAYDNFGRAVAMDGDLAIVGAPKDDDGGVNAGTAFIFARNPGTGVWSEVQKLQAGDAAEEDLFGWSVDIDGNYAVVGAYLADLPGSDAAGAAYVFERHPVSGVWSQVQKLTAFDAATNDYFGYSVAVSGSAIAVGSPKDEFPTPTNAGSVRIYDRLAGSGWVERSTVLASNAGSSDECGIAVALQGSELVIGAHQEDSQGTDSGCTYVFGLDDSFCTNKSSISVASGGSQTCVVNAGLANANLMYLVLGTTAGTSPGFVLGGQAVPLNPDPPFNYFNYTLINPNAPPWSASLGFLDPAGRASATFTIPSGAPSNLIGLELHHAYLVYDPFVTYTLTHASNAAPVSFVP